MIRRLVLQWLGLGDVSRRVARCEDSIRGLDRAAAALYITDKPKAK